MIRVRVLERVKAVPYSIKDEETGQLIEGVSCKQPVRYMWGENSAIGTVRVQDERSGYEPGEYTVHPDSFELVNGTLRTAKFLKLVPANGSTGKAA